jgi:predicted porin
MRTTLVAAAGLLLAALVPAAVAQDMPPAPDATPTVSEVAALRQMLDDMTRRVAMLESQQVRSASDELQSLRLLLDDVDRRLSLLAGTPRVAELKPLSLPAGMDEAIPLPGLSANAAGAAVSSAKAAADAAEAAGDDRGLWPSPYPDDRTPPDADTLDFYGSFRVRFAASEDSTEIADRFSRAGVSKGIRWGSQWRFRGFGRIEFGFNMVNNNPVFVTGGDPGFSVGQGGQAIGTRLGYVGLDTPFGTVSFGKQWGVYSDVSGFTDQFATYGGDASGTYNAGSDGGISGTGRAETAMQYRNKFGPVAIGLQAQFRSRTDAARRFADSVGGSVVTDILPHFNGGVAFNYVRDGVDEPEPNQPKRGDQAVVVGARYLRQPLTLAVTYNRSENHEVDDLGRYFDASGTEFYAQYDFTQRWFSWGGYNHLTPRDHSVGDFRLEYFLGGIGYRWRDDRAVLIEAKFEDSKRSDGSASAKTVVTIGTNVGW